MSSDDDPAPPQPTLVFAALAQHGVQCVVIGGLAAQLHGSMTPTMSIDISPDSSPANLARLGAALTALHAREWVPGFGFPLQLPMDRRRLRRERVLLTHTSYGRLDVIPQPHGIPGGFDELAPRSRDVTAYGQVLRVAALADLERSHLAGGRDKDVIALSRLGTLKQQLAERGPQVPFELRPRASNIGAAEVGLHDALIAAERLARVFDQIRPALAHVRRELYRAVDEVMYGEEQTARTHIARAWHEASQVQSDIRSLRGDLASAHGLGTSVTYSHYGANVAHLVDGAREEVAMGERLLAAASRLAPLCERDDARDLLIEARLHVATADNRLDLLQIQLEQSARMWEFDGRDSRGRD